MGRVEEWLAWVQPDIVCMQETKLPDANFPALSFKTLGYDTAHAAAHHGQCHRNGGAVLSNLGIDATVGGFVNGEPADPEARRIPVSTAGLSISSAYVPNGRDPEHEQYQFKLAWLDRLRKHLEQ